jgi:hypothetical protein
MVIGREWRQYLQQYSPFAAWMIFAWISYLVSALDWKRAHNDRGGIVSPFCACGFHILHSEHNNTAKMVCGVWVWVAGVLLTPLAMFCLVVLKSKLDYPEKTMFYCFLNACIAPMRVFSLGPFKHGRITLEKVRVEGRG